MKFGVREVCDCAFTSLDGKTSFAIDTAKMSTLESASTTVYAQGGRGFSRLAAWEGEKTLTFTVEDALLTTESFQALLGKAKEIKTSNTTTVYSRYTMTTTDFAGYYRVTAQTLFRDVATGEDHAAVITIPKAKLQSNISLSMAPNGDPAAFTFTFDAFNDGSGELCYIDVAENATDVNVSVATTVIVYQTNGTVISVVGTEPTDQTTTETTLTYDENGGKIKLGEKEVITLASGQEFTDMRRSLSSTQRTAITVPAGSTTTWFVI